VERKADLDGVPVWIWESSNPSLAASLDDIPRAAGLPMITAVDDAMARRQAGDAKDLLTALLNMMFRNSILTRPRC